MTNRYDAANQFANRPADESFGTLPAFLAHLNAEKQISRESTRAIKDLRADPHTSGAVNLTSPKGTARLTHWSFGQLARIVNAPAGYLRSLPADITSAAINYGISKAARQDLKVLARTTTHDDGSQGEPVIRAITSTSYSRVWSADLFGTVADQLAPLGFDLPPVWPGLDKHGTGKAGAYAGDRDAFLILTRPEASIVHDPTARRSMLDANGSNDGGKLFPAIMVRNSDVGAAAVTIEQLMIAYICGNHILWGVETASNWKRRHVGQNAERESVREILRLARQLADRDPAADERIIRALADREIAETREGVIEELRAIGYSETDAIKAYEATETQQSRTTASPRSYWGIVQGTTWISQTDGWQDDRLSLDQLAGKVLARGRALVAA